MHRCILYSYWLTQSLLQKNITEHKSSFTTWCNSNIKYYNVNVKRLSTVSNKHLALLTTWGRSPRTTSRSRWTPWGRWSRRAALDTTRSSLTRHWAGTGLERQRINHEQLLFFLVAIATLALEGHGQSVRKWVCLPYIWIYYDIISAYLEASVHLNAG